MGNSGATVKVYIGPVLAKTYKISLGAPGTVWHVFDYNAGSGEILAVNTMHYQSSPSDVGRNGVSGAGSEDSGENAASTLEEQDLDIIFNEAVEK